MAAKTIHKKTAKATSKKGKKPEALRRAARQPEPSGIVNVKRESTQADKTATPGRALRVHKATLITAGIIILLGVFLYFGRGLIVAAVVNGQPITRFALISKTEKASGRQALASLIRNTLVEQEARAQNVTVTDQEINTQIKTIEDNLSKQGQKIDQMLALEGMTRDDLRRIVRLDLLVTKLVGKDIKITDKQVNDYIEKNKDALPKDKSGEALKKEVREQLRREQLPQKAQAWFASLEKKANIVKFVDY